MGSCAARPTAVSSVWNQLASVSQTLPSKLVNATIALLTNNGGSTDGGFSLPVSGIVPRAQAELLFVNLGITLGTVAATFVRNLGGVLSCDALNRSIGAVKGAFCCDFMTALFWFVSAWYFIAFSMCCCGFSASIFGYKRLPNKLWGPDKDVRAASLNLVTARNDDDVADEKPALPPQRSLRDSSPNRGNKTMVPPSSIVNPVRPQPRVSEARAQHPPTEVEDPSAVPYRGHRISGTAVHPMPLYMASAEQYAPPQRGGRNPYGSPPGGATAPPGPAPGAFFDFCLF
jgi:hypothetical protein